MVSLIDAIETSIVMSCRSHKSSLHFLNSYLCGETGHSTMTCPHRISPGYGCSVSSDVATSNHMILLLRDREKKGQVHAAPLTTSKDWQLESAILKLHSRRSTSLEFHPVHNSIVFSGDKKGEIAMWNFEKVFERTIYKDINRWQTTALRFLPGSGNEGMCLCSTSHDGTVKLIDPEVGASSLLYNANQGRNWEGNREMEDNTGSAWVTMMGMDVIDHNTAAAGDSEGSLTILDTRQRESSVSKTQLQKKGTKVQSVHVHPSDNNILMTAGNDYVVRLVDSRVLGINFSSAVFATLGDHTKVVNSALFSPVTGRKIMTTSQDNRLRIWDNWSSGGNLEKPDREIIHSHNFNRYLTPFRADWDLKDPTERLAIIGRYISEDYSGIALHPVDLIDTGTGGAVAELVDPNVTTICPLNKVHPRLDIIITGSSRSLYAWHPRKDDVKEEGIGEGEGGGGGGAGPSQGNKEGKKLPGWLQPDAFVLYDADPGSGGKWKGKRARGD